MTIGAAPQGGHQPQATLQRHKRNEDGGFAAGMPGVHLAKVVGRNADGTFDVTTSKGGTFVHVPVVSSTLGNRLGEVYLPKFTPANPLPSPTGNWDTPGPSGVDDLYAVIAAWGGNARSCAILGFVQPPNNRQMIFSTPGLKVERHESDVWSAVTPDGAAEMHWPDGTYLRVGSSLTPHDMAAENAKWAPSTSGPAVQFEFKHSSGFTITFDGSALHIGAGTQHPLVFADALATWLNSHTHSGVTTGSGDSGPPVTPVVQASIESGALTSS